MKVTFRRMPGMTFFLRFSVLKEEEEEECDDTIA
jgi:hypothetical protein